jgi:hypothetical protein
MLVGKRNLLVVLTIMTVLAIGGASAVLANGNSGNVIYACVNNNSGTVKIVAADTVCHQNSTLVHWNQEGTPGMDGADGADGVDGQDGSDGQDGTDGQDGADGADGTAGISGYEQVVHAQTYTDVADDDFLTVGVTCPGGKKVLGGGASGFITAQTHLVSSHPSAADESEWAAIFQATAAADTVSISAYAICGFVAP